MELSSFLTPFLLLTTWSVFMFWGDSVTKLVSLLFISLILPLIYMSRLKLFWPCGLLLILMSSGLIVIFAYIVSLHQKGSSRYSKAWLICFLSFGVFMLNWKPSSDSIYHYNWSVSVELSLSLILFVLLLFLVISFIRNVYSKGGGFRKKF